MTGRRSVTSAREPDQSGSRAAGAEAGPGGCQPGGAPPLHIGCPIAGRRPVGVSRARTDRLPAAGPQFRGRDARRRPAARGARPCCGRDVGRRRLRRGIATSISYTSRRRCSRTASCSYVYRKSYLPNYGLFDERRFFGAGSCIGAVDSRLGVRLGICICEDFWHLPVPYLLAHRWRADADQHLVLAWSRHRGSGGGRARLGRFMADADARLRRADHVLRRVRQPRRCRRGSHVLGWLAGHRSGRGGELRGAAAGGGAVRH